MVKPPSAQQGSVPLYHLQPRDGEEGAGRTFLGVGDVAELLAELEDLGTAGVGEAEEEEEDDGEADDEDEDDSVLSKEEGLGALGDEALDGAEGLGLDLAELFLVTGLDGGGLLAGDGGLVVEGGQLGITLAGGLGDVLDARAWSGREGTYVTLETFQAW